MDLGRLALVSEIAGGHTILKLADHALFKMVRYVLLGPRLNMYIYYMSLQYCNKSKSQLTSPTPAQAASCCVISGTYSI
jgi:hypothetical protein